eukprot:CAMPEP_0196740098 /NCGR_PEP_ID=MMETSP1091-20130531/29045_1 /TAXON_ID=302021 /ORGANISM="Rhodomonas sp., Strain CCMP768" /LENGTH=490 /DNA_ID=CAMNT_0042085031 /DNA_START=156 /DNA_END=1628 /DNA_ORIENTATION=+
MEATTHTIESGATFTTRALNGTIPGPTIRLMPGDVFSIEFQNKLADQGIQYEHNAYSAPDESNIHFHGLHVSGELPSDDTTVVVSPGQSRQYSTQLPASHMPGTHWLHPHRHGSTALQVGGGAALALIVEDPPGSLPPQVEEAPEILLVVMQVDAGEFSELVSDSADGLARLTNPPRNAFLLVNGEYEPTVAVASGQWTRLRIVYAAWLEGDLDFAVAGCEMVLLAKDGIYISDFPRPISLAPVTPAGRADIMLRCPDPSAEYRVTGWAGTGGQTGTIATVTTSAGPAVASVELEAWTPTYPAYLKDLQNTPADEGCACTTELEGDNEVNGAAFAHDFFLHEAFLGAVVERRIESDEHPYHQHVNPFQLISRFAETEYYRPGDWHDTYTGFALVRHTAADFEGKIMVHCHRLLHEDEGMMTMERVNLNGPCSCGAGGGPAAWVVAVVVAASVAVVTAVAGAVFLRFRRNRKSSAQQAKSSSPPHESEPDV